MSAILPAADGAQLIDDLGSAMNAAYGSVERQLQAEVARRVYKHLTVPDDLLQRLRNIRELETYSQRLLGQIDAGQIAAMVAQSAGTMGIAAAALGFGAILDGGPISANAVNAVTALQLDMQNALQVMHNRILRYAPDAYRDLTAMIVPNMLLGVNTLQQTQAQLVEAFLSRGITGFTAKNGANWRIGTYAEMATRTTGMRAWSDAGVARMQGAGIATVTPIGSSISPCPKCLPWQGKVLSTDGTPAGMYLVESVLGGSRVPLVIDATLATAREAGLQHPNCRDVLVAALAGLPVPGAAPEGFTLSRSPQGAIDEATLRTLEVRVREAKRMESVASTPAAAAEYRRARLDTQAEIRAHVTATGAVRRNYREQLHFADGQKVLAAV